MRQEKSHILLGIIIMLVLWVVSSFVTYRVFVRGADHRDFYPMWAGTRLLISGEKDIYSLDSTRSIQLQLYHRLIPEGRDQQGFAYPILLAIFILPFALIQDVEIATAVFQGFTLITFTGCLFLLRPHQDKSSPFVILLLVLWQFPLLMIFQGQVTVIPFLAFSLALYMVLKGNYLLAGLFLSLGLVKPEIFFIPLITFMVVALQQRKWKLVIGFLVSTILFLGISFIWAGWWLPGWIHAIFRYSQYAKSFWPIVEIWKISPIAAIGTLLLIGFTIFKMLKKPFLLLVSSIPIGMLLLPQTLMWGLSMLTIPLICSWHGKLKLFVLGTWAAGWLGLFFTNYNDWWKIQATILPGLALVAVFLTSTIGSTGTKTTFITKTDL